MTDEACICYLENISKLFEQGKENCTGDALELQQKHIDALQYAIKELRKNERSQSNLISRSALKEVAKTKFGNDITSITVLKLFEELIDNAPAVDATVNANEVRPQGQWIKQNYDFAKHYYRCSICGREINTHGQLSDYPFCNYCGADMRGGTE